MSSSDHVADSTLSSAVDSQREMKLREGDVEGIADATVQSVSESAAELVTGDAMPFASSAVATEDTMVCHSGPSTQEEEKPTPSQPQTVIASEPVATSQPALKALTLESVLGRSYFLDFKVADELAFQHNKRPRDVSAEAAELLARFKRPVPRVS